MIYNNFNSSAVKSVEILENTVKIVYNSNTTKEYTFECQNTTEFTENLSKELTGIELNDSKASVGRFLHQQIKSGALVETK